MMDIIGIELYPHGACGYIGQVDVIGRIAPTGCVGVIDAGYAIYGGRTGTNRALRLDRYLRGQGFKL